MMELYREHGKKGYYSRGQAEKEIRHNPTNQLNKAFQEGYLETFTHSPRGYIFNTLWGGFRISSPAGVCYDFMQQFSGKSQKFTSPKSPDVHTHTIVWHQTES